MISTGPTSRRRRGFTLLELTLSMSLVAIVSLSLYASMTVAWRAKRTAENAVRSVRGGAIAADLICRDLESVPRPNGILAGPFVGMQQPGAAAGSEYDAVDFYTIGEDAAPSQQTAPLQEGIRHVQLAVRSDVDPPVLVRRVWRNLLSTVQEDPTEEILCRGVRSLMLRYFDGTSWNEEWDSSQENNVLPLAVEMTLDLQADPSMPAVQAQSQPVSRITRLVPLACGRPSDQSDTSTSGSAQ